MMTTPTTPATPATIFISYRRADSSESAGRIYDRLIERYGRERVFKDVDSIPPGVPFPEYIVESIEASDVALVIIGPRWLDASVGFARRRLDDPADFVRVEIETALRLGIAVIPVLVTGATLPPARRLPESLRPLVTQNGVSVRPDPDFHRDIERVYSAIDYWQGKPRRSQVGVSAPTQAPAPANTAEAPAAPPMTELPSSAKLKASAPPAIGSSRSSAAAQPTRAVATTLMDHPPKPRRPRPLAPILSIIAALVVLAISFGLLHSFAPTLFAQANIPATETANADASTATSQAKGAQATLTAQAGIASKPYTPTGVGPCDTVDPPYSRDSRAYWYWRAGSGVTCSSDGTVATIPSGRYDFLDFYGFPGDVSFPRAFTTQFTLAINRSSVSDCVQFFVSPATNAQQNQPAGVIMCGDGSWSSQYTGTSSLSQHGKVSAPFHVLVTMTGSSMALSINSQEAIPAAPFVGQVADIYWYGLLSAGNSYSVSSFRLDPTAL